MRGLMVGLASVVVALGCASGFAYTGSGESAVIPLETISPTLDWISAVTERSLYVMFSEPMLESGASTPWCYVTSGAGVGTLTTYPTWVSGSDLFTLTWDTGEMQDGATVTVTATGLQDLVGNPIDPEQSSASCAGLGTAPVFLDLTAYPAQAAAGEAVTILFTASEALSITPMVAVNGHDAVFAGGDVSYTYTYTVQQSDPPGMASVSVIGFDLAWNVGSATNTTALEIIEHGSALPLYTWPTGLVLLAAGVLVLVWRRRRLGLLMLLLLVSSTAPAVGPAVSNVTYSQGPGGEHGTQVDIYYNLDSSNGPCAITVSLSKDGGLDGYAYPITSITGDIAEMTSGSGYHIVWDIRADYPEENIPQACIRVTADDGAGGTVVVTSLAINSGAATTANPLVTLNNTCTGGPVDYMASESASFTGATWWQTYSATPLFTLSGAVGSRKVYFKVHNGAGESSVVHDSIFLEPEMLPVAAGTFAMGRTSAGDDAQWGSTNEDPPHEVTLGAYQIGKYDVTNKQYCDVLNWALMQGFLKDSSGNPWNGTGDIYAGGNLQMILFYTDYYCNIQYLAGVFSSKTWPGLPAGTIYSMDTHPVMDVSWFGGVAFCNWLSLWEGLTPCYDMTTANWPLTVAPPTRGGYRLPTEAEWERAAAWDGSKHWIYGYTSDDPAIYKRCNCYIYMGEGIGYFSNPLGLTDGIPTSPVGWFNGVNVSPNGNGATINSVSPAGAYDMSGNVFQMCGDWYLETYYSGGDMTNPTGPTSGLNRVARGGSLGRQYMEQRSAGRSYFAPASTNNQVGFRLARS